MPGQVYRPGIATVAAEAGVSPTTVSHALSGNRAVSAQTRERILAAVEKLNYRPNMVAKSLRSQRTQSIALLVVDITNPFYPSLARAVYDRLGVDGYLTLMGNTDGDARVERTLLEEMVARGVDGVIALPVGLSAGEVRDIVGPKLPLVLIGDSQGAPADQVLTDEAQGITEAVDYLVRKGFREFGFVGGPADGTGGQQRLAAYRSGLRAAGLNVPSHLVEHGPSSREGGTVAARRLFARGGVPQVVLCADDVVAIGVVEAAREAGLRVPEDLAIVGFDDLETASLMTPGLTTISNPAAAVGEACVRAILRRIDAPAAPYRRTVLPTKLVVRDSA